MAKYLSWKKKKEKDSTRGLIGMLIGLIIGVAFPRIIKALGFGFAYRFYWIVQNWLPVAIKTILPTWFEMVFYGIIGMILGLIIDLGITAEK